MVNILTLLKYFPTLSYDTVSNISFIWVGFSAKLEIGLEEFRESRPIAPKQVSRKWSS